MVDNTIKAQLKKIVQAQVKTQVTAKAVKAILTAEKAAEQADR